MELLNQDSQSFSDNRKLDTDKRMAIFDTREAWRQKLADEAAAAAAAGVAAAEDPAEDEDQQA